MAALDILEFLDLGRAKSIQSDSEKLSNGEAVILNEVKEKDFGVDLIYFNTDEETNNSFPAVFLKKVANFNDEIYLKDIAETQRKIWNYKKVLFLYVYSETEIRIYNCSEKPLIVTKDDFDYKNELQEIEINSYQYSDKQQLQELNKLFSRIAIDTGIIWTLEDAKIVRDKINLQKRVDKYLVTSLVNTAEHLRNQGLEIDFIHKIILRSLFLLYLEDRGAAEKDFYNQIKKDAESYFDILDDVTATYDLFKRLENHFNGNVFTLEQDENISREQLQIIKTCFIRGNEKNKNPQLFDDWKQFRLFNFKIIQIELLSEIYENFLAETDPTLKEDSGTYYTPPSLVEFILNEKLPVNNGETEYNVKTLDPSCGSGIFLVESFKRLVKRYENAHSIDNLSDFDTLVKLLKENIFGIEIHPQAIKVAAFSLYLALVDKLDPKNLWQNKNYRLPYLVNDPKEKNEQKKGRNLFCRDTISDLSSIDELQNFQLVVGNPPFGDKNLLDTIRNYCNKENFAKEKVLPFLHKATFFAPHGEIALIFNTKVLTNTGGTYKNFREWLFIQCYVEKVFNFSILRKAKKNFGGQLFGDATGPISIVFYKNHQPDNRNDTIVYYAPKTWVRSNVIEGLSIDSNDIKYIPREECQKPDTKIWKVAMWGGINDWNLIKKLNNSKFQTVENFIVDNNIKSGVGFQLLTQKKDTPKYSETLTSLDYLDAECVNKYFTPNEKLNSVRNAIKTSKAINFYKEFYNVNNITEIEQLTAFRRLGDIDAYINPHIILKKGLENNSVCASFIESQCSFRDGVYGFYTNESKIDELYKLLSFFNSKFSTYYLFMTISSYGIEREQIMKNEYLSIPFLLNDEQGLKIIEATKELLIKMKSKSFLNNDFEEQELKNFINENIDSTILNGFNFEEYEKVLVSDAILYNLDLFHNQEKSKAILPATEKQPEEYAQIISSELNEFLEGQNVFANATVYNLKGLKSSPLMMIKISHEKTKKEISISNENIGDELMRLDQYLWEQKAKNIYFRKKLNYKRGDDIYIIRPNQRRFWSQSMAFEDASELILEILNGVHDEA